MTNELAVLQQAKEKIVQMSIEFGPKVVTAILILVAGFFVARWVVGVVSRWLSRLEMEPPVRDLLLRVLWVVVMGLFAVMALQNLGVQLLPLIAGLGVAGAGIALAMQGVLGNLAAGLTSFSPSRSASANTFRLWASRDASRRFNFFRPSSVTRTCRWW